MSKLMQNNLMRILNSPINKSATKQTHAFGKQSRFLKQKEPYCQQSSYDLKVSDMTRSIILSTSQSKMSREKKFSRFDAEIRMRSLSPSPNSYRIQSFVDSNIKKSKKSTFSKDQKLKLKTTDVPGPGNYKVQHNPESQLSYSMRSKPQKSQAHWNKTGPGQYFTEQNNFKSSKAVLGKIPRDMRFRDRDNGIPAPDTYKLTSSMISTKYMKSSRYTFSKGPRHQRIKTQTPGPGAYQQFSQFPSQGLDLVAKVYNFI